MAIAETHGYMPQAPRPRLRLLEDERWLAFVLLVPTLALLGMFIAYPFVRGILLSVTNSRVGVPGEFVGLANFYKIFNDGIFRTSVYNTFLYTGVTTVFKLALGLWLAMLLNRNFRGKALTRAFILLPFIIPTVLSTFAWRWMFDPTFSVLNWLLYHFGLITGRINWLGDPDLAMISIIIVKIWRGGALFALSLLRRPQDHQPQTQRAPRHRRPQAVAAILAHHLAAAAARDHGRGAVLGDSDLRRLPDRVCDDRRRTRPRDAPVRHLRLSDRHRHRPFERGRRHLARHVSDPVPGRHHPASLYPSRRGPLSHDRRCSVEKVGVLLRADGAVPAVSVVPVLLDGDHFGAAGWRALPALECDQLQSVLDLETDLGPRQIPVRRDAVRIVAVEHDVHRDGVNRYLARVWCVRRLCPVTAELSICRQSGHRHFHHLSGAPDAAVHSAGRDYPQLSAG